MISGFPYEFSSSGTNHNFYDECPIYEAQTIISLPSYWTLEYDPNSEVTTLTIKGKAENCPKRTKALKATKAPKATKATKATKAPK